MSKSNIYIKRFFILLSSTGEIICTRPSEHGAFGDIESAAGMGEHPMGNDNVASFAQDAKRFMKYIETASENSSGIDQQGDKGKDNDVFEFSCGTNIYSFLNVGKHILVAQSGKGVGRYVAAQRLYSIRGMLLLLFGDPNAWSQDRFELDGLENIIDHFLGSTDMSFLLNGTRHVPLKRKGRDQVQRLVMTFENNPLVHYTLITLGHSVLYSTLPPTYTRLISEFLIVRPLETAVSMTIPVYINETWVQLVISRYRAFHVAVITNIDTRKELKVALKEFEEKFHDATKLLPTEEPPVLLRHYANYNIAAFALVKCSNGIAVVPELRDGPGDEKSRINRIFQWFFCRIKDMKEGGFVNVTMSNNVYAFQALKHHGCEIYALLSDKVEPNDTIKMCKEIVDAAQKKHILLQDDGTEV